jgi:hypothetical protein
MGIFKEMAGFGAYFIEIGNYDKDSWSELMIKELGQNVKPFLDDIRQWSLIIAQRRKSAQIMKVNCWEFQTCDKHAAGEQGNHIVVCPVFKETKLNGIHGGENGGRACWIVPGTLCGGRIKRSLIPKFMACNLCDFKKAVLKEERSDCVVSDKFLNMLVH